MTSTRAGQPAEVTFEQAARQPPRVLRVWYPKPSSMHAVLVFLGCLAVLVPLGVALGSGFDFPMRTAAVALMGIAAGWALLLVVLVLLLAAIRRRRLNTPPGRGRRLRHLLNSPGGGERFPHRSLEFARRRQLSELSARRKGLLDRLPAGIAIVANARRAYAEAPDIGITGFEPLRVDVPDEQLTNLLVLGYSLNEEQAAEAARWMKDPGSIRLRHRRWWGKKAAVQLTRALGLAWVASILAGVVWMGMMGQVWILLFWAGFGLLFWLSHARHIHTAWWLVPGGIAFAAPSLFRSRRIRYARATDSALLIDQRSAILTVVHEGRIHRCEAQPVVALAVLAGWRYTGETPTREQIEELLGGRD